MSELSFGRWRVDLGRATAHCGAETVGLTTIERDLLAYLHSRVGQDVSREELHREVWSHGARVVSRAVDSTVKRLRRKLEADPKAPRQLLTVFGVGYRLVSGGDGAGLVGRGALLLALRAELRPGLLAVTGPAGVGKSTLMRAALPPGSPVVDLRGCHSLDAVRAELARALGVGDPAQLGPTLALSHATLGLDDYEHVPPDVDTWLGTLATAAPTLTVVLGTRRPVSGARPFPVPCLDPAPALQLLRDASPSAEDDDALRALAADLDHLPLALVLAARWLSVVNADEYRRRWRDDGAWFGGGLDAALARSLALLSAPARQLAGVAALFQDSIPTPALLAVAGGPTPEGLHQLLQLGLVSPHPEHPSTLCMLSTVRATVRRAVPTDRAPLNDWCVRTARAALRQLRTGDDRALRQLVLVQREWPRARQDLKGDPACWTLLATHRLRLDAEPAPHLALAREAQALAESPELRWLAKRALAQSLIAHRQRDEAQLHARALHDPDDPQRTCEAHLLQARVRAGDHDDDGARRIFGEQMMVALAHGWDHLVAVSANLLGGAQRRLGDLSGAEDSYAQCVAAATRAGSTRELRRCLCNQAIVHLQREEYEQALARYEQASALARGMLQRRGEAHCLGASSVAMAASGRAQEALERSQRAFVALQWSPMPRAVGEAHYRVGSAALDCGHTQQARLACRAASAYFQRAGHLRLQLVADVMVALAWLWQDQPEKARIALDGWTEGRARETGDYALRWFLTQALIDHGSGAPGAARRWLHRAADIPEEYPHAHMRAVVRHTMGLDADLPAPPELRRAAAADDYLRKVLTRWPLAPAERVPTGP